MTEFEVPNMTCGHCVATITKAVQAADPAARLDIDLTTKRVRIEGSANAECYATAIRDAGYEPVSRS